MSTFLMSGYWKFVKAPHTLINIMKHTVPILKE